MDEHQQAMIDVERVRPILDQISGKWTLLVLIVLCPKPARFNELMRRLDGITHKALSDTLQRLEQSGLIHRKVLPTKPVGVEYSITPLGHTLREPFGAIYSWALKHAPEMTAASRDGREASDAA